LRKIDPRTAADVAQQLQELLKLYATDWKEVDFATGAPKGVSAALIGISARFAEVLIQRLNQVPHKNFLAFLELLGAALLPPQPARVPLTFLLATGSLVDALVPAETQVAAPPAPGESEPVIYETETELVATAAQLALALVRDPEEDTYADYSKDIITTGSPGTPVFHGNRQIAHILYLGHSHLLDSPGIANLSLIFDIIDLQLPARDDFKLKWEIWNGLRWQEITPPATTDQTRSLRQRGTIDFGQIPAVPTTKVGGISKEWIRCLLLTPITRSSVPRSGMVRANHLPQIKSVGMRVKLHKEGLLLDGAYSSASGLIDLSRAFYPFGEKPKLNDTLWLELEEAFSNAGATVTLDIKVTTEPPPPPPPPPEPTPLPAKPSDDQPTPLPAKPSDDLRLLWEAWNGAWVALGTSSKTGAVAPIVPGFSDTTNAFSKSGNVTFTLPPQVARYSVNGKESFWIRVRIISGNYGKEGYYTAIAPKPKPPESPFEFNLPTFQPPSIHSLKAAYDLHKPAPPPAQTLPEAVLAENDSVFKDFTSLNTQGFFPFQPSQDARPTLYLGFLLPTGRTTFPNTPITMFLQAIDLQYGEKTIPIVPDVSRGAADPGNSVTHKFVVTNPGPKGIIYIPKVLGSQWTPVVTLIKSDGSPGPASPAQIEVSPKDWVELDVQVTVPSGTPIGASDSGVLVLQLVSPDQLLYTSEFVTFSREVKSQTQQLQLTWEYWSGAKWSALSVRDGTSNLTTTGTVEFLAPPDFTSHTEFGTDAWWLRVRCDAGDYHTDPRINRIFLNTAMAAQTLTVRNEILGSSDGSGNQRFRTTRAPVLAGQSLEVREPEMPSTGTPSEIWVTWQEVADFYASDSRSRHYTLDHISGEVCFGDGVSGMVPPVGLANIRLTHYKTGGGVRGNRPAGSIIQLKTTVPYVDKVTNYLAASGGVDAESINSLVTRAPMEIRHRRRAVTQEDYEDLAHLASPEVAHVRCVPNRDLAADPFGKSEVLGKVSLILVPNSTASKPQPSVELVRRVQKFISSSCPVTATAVVVGPLYLRVEVQAEIGLASPEEAGTAAAKVQNKLDEFLHPLTGGFERKGWEFGREPHRSDLYRLIEAVPGVDHIRAMTVTITEEPKDSRQTGRFLVYSGAHTIKLVVEA
jgi:hypothetical protein